MSEALESYKKQQRKYQQLILKSGHHDAQKRFHEKEKTAADVELDAVVRKSNVLESQLTKEDLEIIRNSPQPKEEKKDEPIKEGSEAVDQSGPLGNPEE